MLITINRGRVAVSKTHDRRGVGKRGRSRKRHLKVKKVGPDECEGIVGLTLDQVQNNRRGELKQAQ